MAPSSVEITRFLMPLDSLTGARGYVGPLLEAIMRKARRGEEQKAHSV